MPPYYRLTITFIIIILLLASIGAYGYLYRSRSGAFVATTTPVSYECSADGFVCPDGTIVGRTGPTCEFASCPGVVPAAGVKVGTLFGSVTLSPVCPVEMIPPRPECAPKQYATDIRIYDSHGKLATSTKTNASGVFMIQLFPGTYTVHAGPTNSVYPRCADVQIAILAGASSTIDISCDSGIR